MLSDKNKPKRRVKINADELESLVDEIVGDGLPEGIFGVLDNNLDRMQKLEKSSARKPEKIVPRKPLALPKMTINSPQLPPEAEGRHVNNVVNVPKSILRKLANNVDRNTSELNQLLLTSLVPLILSYETGTNYAKAALKDGLNLEIDFDEGLSEAVKHIGYLNVLFFYIKNSRIPLSVKKHFTMEFSKLLAQQTLTALLDANKAQDRQKLTQELQAVVYSGQRKKTTVHTVNADKKKPGEVQRQPMPVAVKRRSR